MFKSLHFICIYLHKIVMDYHKFATFAKACMPFNITSCLENKRDSNKCEWVDVTFDIH